MLNAMQAGILTKSTKARLEELEAQKEKLELDIMKEQLHDETLTRDQVVLWLKTLKTLDLTNDDNKRILVDTFINSIIVYDNKLAVSFNFRDGAGDIPLLRVGCSDGDGLGAPQAP